MSEVTSILSAIEEGDAQAAEQLLPIVYQQLRQLAAQMMARERPGQTLQATALVHEAYLRMVGPGVPRHWSGRAHFFAAAAEAMRRIVVEAARRKERIKRGGRLIRVELNRDDLASPGAPDEVLIVDEAIGKLATEDPEAAQLVKLRYFAGLSVEEAAEAMHLSRSTAYERWSYARACLRCELRGQMAGRRD